MSSYQKKQHWLKKHGHKLKGFAGRTEIIKAMKDLSIPDDYVQEIRFKLTQGNRYNRSELTKIFNEMGIDHYADEVWDQLDVKSDRYTLTVKEILEGMHKVGMSIDEFKSVEKYIEGEPYTYSQLIKTFRDSDLEHYAIKIAKLYNLKEE